MDNEHIQNLRWIKISFSQVSFSVLGQFIISYIETY